MRTLVRSAAVSFTVLLLLATSAVAQERWQIVHAEYGAGRQFVDVTSRVQSLVRGDVLDFRVSHDSLEADPAQGHRKVLRLQVRNLHGQVRQLTFEDSAQVHLTVENTNGHGGPGHWQGLQITSAQYGANHMTDVTARIAGMVQGDRISFRVAYDTVGVDPDEGRTKHLDVHYSYNGVPGQITVRDGETLNLPGVGSWNGHRQGLQITSAEYGAQHMADVTARLAAMVRGNQLSLRIAYDTIGVDPDEGRTKHIVVNYTYNGVPSQVTLRDGETLTLPGAGNWNGPPDGTYGALTILRAEYGTGSRELDVTSRLSAQVRGDSLQLRVTNDSMGGDPANEQEKWLNVWYLYNDRAAHVTVHEKDVLSLPGTGDANYYQGRLQITRAQYGAEFRFADVTSLLNSRIQNDSLSLRINHNSMQADPAPGERKVLTVFYIYNGRRARAFVNDNDVLILPVGTAQGGRGDRDDDDDDYYRRFWPGRSMNELRVLQASWGVEGRSRDVTGQLNGMVRGNQLNVAVNDGTMGGDPAPGAQKRLRVIYMLRGLRYETNVPEGGSLTLP
jgi:hypothetical protein